MVFPCLSRAFCAICRAFCAICTITVPGRLSDSSYSRLPVDSDPITVLVVCSVEPVPAALDLNAAERKISTSGNYSFANIPQKIITMIAQELPLNSLYRFLQCSKDMRNACYDDSNWSPRLPLCFHSLVNNDKNYRFWMSQHIICAILWDKKSRKVLWRISDIPFYTDIPPFYIGLP